MRRRRDGRSGLGRRCARLRRRRGEGLHVVASIERAEEVLGRVDVAEDGAPEGELVAVAQTTLGRGTPVHRDAVGDPVTLRVERSKKGVGVVLRSAGAYDKIENIAVVDEKGTRRGISRGRWFGSAPTWDIAQPESVLAKWKLVVTLTTKAELVRARFDLRDLLVPKRK